MENYWIAKNAKTPEMLMNTGCMAIVPILAWFLKLNIVTENRGKLGAGGRCGKAGRWYLKKTGT